MKQNDLRRVIDIGMTALLLLQMACQVMGEAAHEWLGMSMTLLVIVHQLLNRRWYDFAGKRLIPFCSHGGGHFGQSLTAIAKLAPASNIGQGLSIHYSGGSMLSDDVAAWLEENHLIPEA